jgi:hypothetical protein
MDGMIQAPVPGGTTSSIGSATKCDVNLFI